MSLTAEAGTVAKAVPECGREGCLACNTSRTPAWAYRPHTLRPDCWCTRDGEGHAVLSDCWLVKAYLPDRLWRPGHP